MESNKGDNMNNNLKELMIDNFNKGLHKGMMLNEPLGFATVEEKNNYYQKALSLSNDDKIKAIRQFNTNGYNIKKIRNI